MITWTAIIGSILGGVFAAIVAACVTKRVMRRWPQHGKWGINPEPVNCPRCDNQQPKTRLPTSFRQAMWGGWSCKSCGCEMDKYGKPLDKAT
jgi:hypothetical protein